MLERWARRPKSAQALALRCRIVLAAADGEHSKEIAARLGCTHADGRAGGGGALPAGPRRPPRRARARASRGRSATRTIERVIVKTLEEQPPDATHWSTRSMAEATGMSQTAISRIWRAFGLKPHRTEHFKLSPDPQFVDKVRDIVGLYLNPPEAAVVLCVDEKSQIQALDRSAPILPLMPGRARAPHPRLRAQRHHEPLRRPRRRLGQGDRRDDPAPPRRGVPQFLNLIERSVPDGPRRPRRARQLLDPQDTVDPALAGSATRASPCTSRPPTAPG